MSERLKFQGKLLEKDQEKRLLEVQVSGLVRSLRDLLDPTEQQEDLRDQEIADQALRLANTVITLRHVNAEMREIRHLIGE
jgi:hypothetical protein